MGCAEATNKSGKRCRGSVSRFVLRLQRGSGCSQCALAVTPLIWEITS
jgi:hypothetical protein